MAFANSQVNFVCIDDVIVNIETHEAPVVVPLPSTIDWLLYGTSAQHDINVDFLVSIWRTLTILFVDTMKGFGDN